MQGHVRRRRAGRGVAIPQNLSADMGTLHARARRDEGRQR